MIYVIGIGPGSRNLMTEEAIKAIEDSEVIVGYKTYINLITEFIGDKEVVQNGMRKEIERCKQAIEIAKTGKTVAVISSGDAGIYGMAGLILELLTKEEADVKVKVVPGVTASIAAEADFVICLYNPRSKGRSEHLAKAFEIMGEFKDKSTPVGIVKDVAREDEEKIICTFETMDFEKVDMTTMVIIGNKATYIHDDLMITPRGYTV